MSPLTNYLFTFLVLLTLPMYGQNIFGNKKVQLKSKIDIGFSTAQKNISSKNYFQAKHDLETVLELALELENNKITGVIYFNIGKVNFIIEDPIEAIRALNKAIKILEIEKDYSILAKSHGTIGDVYMSIKKHKLALEAYVKSENYFNRQQLKSEEINAILKKGQALLTLGKYEEATLALNKAITLASEYKLNKTLAYGLIYLGKVQGLENNIDKGIENTIKGFNIANKYNYNRASYTGALILSRLYENEANLTKSNTYLKQYILLKDTADREKKQLLSPEKKRAVTETILIIEENSTMAGLKKIISSPFNQLTTILSIALITILSLLTLSLYKNNNIRSKSNNVLYKKNTQLIVSTEKAELASKTKADFLSTVTHELRTPLYAVTGLTNMLLDENPKPEQIQHLKSLKFSGDYLLTFINDILQINKIEANKVNVEPEIFDLKKKISNIISALNNSALNNNTKIHLEYDAALPLNYNADQLKISQILINLIGNSIKFTKDGDIWVRASKIDEKKGLYNILFEVEDNGIGISNEKQEHMFESFSQGSIQINRKYGGTGLGLSIVKGLIDILKGKIYLKSELGKGATFFFELPMQYTKEIIKEEKIEYFKNLNKKDLDNINILVVEDNKINQMITKKILAKMHLKCEIVDNGESAVEKVKNGQYDVVLMDIHMPGISGIEATKQIRTFDKELTIFALTAVTIEDKMQEFDDAGFTDIISKPFKQEDFEKKLYNSIAKTELA